MSLKNLTLIVLLSPAISLAGDKYSYSVESIEYATQDFAFPSDSTDYVLIAFTADLNGDGATDLIISTGTNPSADLGDPGSDLILLNNGDNSFSEAAGDKVLTESARQVQIADLDGDGSLDIYFSNQGHDTDPFPGHKDSLLLSGASGYVDASDRLPDIPAFSHGAASGDIDNDGDIDILVLNNELGDINESSYLLLNDGAGNFTVDRNRLPQDLVNFAPFETQNGWAADIADLDNDGWQDLVIGRRSVNAQNQPRLPTRIHWNQGDGSFVDSDTTSLPAPQPFFEEQATEVNEILAHDFDGDGRLDLLVTSVRSEGFSGRSVQMLINQGNRSFIDESLKRLGAVAIQADTTKSAPYFFEFTDVNQDGILDILPEFSSDESDDSPIIWEGTGYGCFNPVTLSEITSNADAKLTLAYGVPVLASGKLTYIEPWIGINPLNQQNVIRLNKVVTLSISANPEVANYFDSCSGYVRTRLDAGQFGLAVLDFAILQTEPSVRIQPLMASQQVLSSVPDNAAQFNPATARLTIPELVIDDSIAYRNLVFNLIDAEQLIFELVSFD